MAKHVLSLDFSWLQSKTSFQARALHSAAWTPRSNRAQDPGPADVLVSNVTDTRDEITLMGVLDLQTRCQFHAQATPGRTGFLITAHELPELKRLVHEGSSLIVAREAFRVEGYLLLSPPQVLEDLNPGFVPATDLDEKGPLMKYVFQIAVAPEKRRAGVGTALIDAAKAAADQGLVADVVTSPVENAVSLRLFERCGFRRVGTLDFPDYPGFGAHASAMLVWTP